jgi:hypothetical protein
VPLDGERRRALEEQTRTQAAAITYYKMHT